MDVNAAISAASNSDAASRTHSFSNAELKGADFLRLMLETLMNQDPLEPISNQDLLAQVSHIKNMETLSNLDATLSAMTYQQQLATAGTLIGREVSGVSTHGANVTGIVTRVQAGASTGVRLITHTGDAMDVGKVTAISEVSGNG